MADTSEGEHHSCTAAASDTGVRLDKFLHSRLPHLSRSYVQQLIESGHVRRAGQTIVSASVKVKPGESYALRVPPVAALALEPVAMALEILYEDEHLLVVNKPAGLAVHPAPGTRGPTLVHGLLAHCGESLSGIGGVARPGIVHRLDKDTSGLMVVAKNDETHRDLSAQLKDRSVSRIYHAVCWGVPAPRNGTIEGAIGRHPKDRKKMAVVHTGGKPARTHYTTEEVFQIGTGAALASLVTCKLETGRTHQIRVHMQRLGNPLVGDDTYGGEAGNWLKKLNISEEETYRFLKDYGRQALHAARLTLRHPALHETMSFETKMPDDMAQLLNDLKHLHDV